MARALKVGCARNGQAEHTYIPLAHSPTSTPYSALTQNRTPNSKQQSNYTAILSEPQSTDSEASDF
jgi:hypothetical protein